MLIQGRLGAPVRLRAIYKFGVFELDSGTKELRKQGIRVRLSGQPFQVLLLLVDHQGECISREQLRETLWPNDAWGDLDLRLNKVVNRVREVLGDSAENPRFLETLPRVGYRFIFPVEKTELPAFDVRPDPPKAGGSGAPGSRFSKRARVLVISILGVLGATLAAALILSLTNKPEVLLDPEPLTSYVGTESSPSFSPDGARIAFVWNGAGQDNSDVYVLRMGDGTLQRLTDNPQRDFAPSWSRDGQQIAFLRETSRGNADVLVMPASGGTSRKVSQIAWRSGGAPELDWTGDSRWIAAPDTAGEAESSIFLISAATGERRRLTSPPRNSRGDFLPSISADGRRLVFTRFVTSEWNDVFMLALGPNLQVQGRPVRLSNLNMRTGRPVWIAGDAALVFAAGGWGDERFLYRMKATQGAAVESLGNVRIPGVQPAYSAATRTLAYARGGEQTGVWEMAATAPHTLKRIIASTASDSQPDFSPDGSLIAFSSNRQRNRDIWVARPDGADVRQLVSFRENGASAPRWSPDGRVVAFESRQGGQSDIYLYSVAEGSIHNLTDDAAEDIVPTWSADGKFVYFCSYRSGAGQIWKMPREGGAAVRMTESGGLFAVESPDGKYLYYTTELPPAVLRRRTLADGSEREIASPVITLPGFAVTAEGVYYLTRSDTDAAVLRYLDLSSGTSRDVIQLPKQPGNGLSVSKDGKRILLSLRENEGSDLTLLRNVR